MEGISTQIKIDDAATAVFQNIASSCATATNSINGFQRAVGQSYNTGKMKAMPKDIDNARLSQTSFNETLRQGGGLASQMAEKIKGIVGAYLGWQAVKKTVEVGDEFNSTMARLNIISNGESPAKIYNDIYKAAQNARIPVAGLSADVAKLGLLAGDRFTGNNELIKFSEILAKSFKVSGGTAQESAAAMHQITQAMASNRLQGDEFVSILENAPLFARAIKNELNGIDLKKASADGLITADVMKRAAFNMADDVNNKLSEIPRTFADNVTIMKNNIMSSLEPLFSSLSKLWNSDFMLGTIGVITLAFQGFGQIAGLAINILVAGLDFLTQHAWLLIPPLTALVFKMAMMAGTAIATAAAFMVKVAADIAETMAIYALIVAQDGLNAAMAACPIIWIIVGIVAITLAILKLIQWLLSWADINVTVVGIVGAIFGFLGTHIFNIFKGVANIVFAVAEFIANVFNHPVYSIVRLFANLAKAALGMARSMTSSFDGVATNLANSFIDGANRAIRAINWVIRALNKIPGVNLSEMGQFAHTASITHSIKKAENNIDKWLENSKPKDYKAAKPFEMSDTFDGAMKGMNFANGMISKLKNKFKPQDDNKQKKDIEKMIKDAQKEPAKAGGTGGGTRGKGKNPLSKPIENTALNTKKIAKNTDNSKLDIRYMREIAERQAINRFTTATINIENNLSQAPSDMDLDGFVDHLSNKLADELDRQVDGYYKY